MNSDGEATVAVVKRITDLDITCDEAISIEHEMYIALRNELTRFRNSERELSDAYLRIRAKLNAYDTPHAPTFEQIWNHTESKLDQLIDRCERAKACAEMRHVIALCGLSFDKLRDRVPAEDDAFREADNAIAEALANAVSPHGMGSSNISLTDPMIVGLVGILLQRPMAYKRTHDDHYAIPITAWETFCVKVNEAIATYEARKKEAGL